MKPNHAQQVATIVAIATIVGLASALDVTIQANSYEESAESLIQKVVAQTTRAGFGIRATRELKAGTVSGKHQGWMSVETVVLPNGAFSYRVLNEGGSERTRNKVFRELLQAETEAWRAGARDAAALTPANYQFTPAGTTANGQIQLRLTPRREDSKLIEGTLTVTADGYPVRLEGRMSKSPSFWVRSVTVVKRYGRFAGVALPVTIESLADVKIFGKSSFSMRYAYNEVNGRSIPQSLAEAAPSFGPSREILALHASLAESQ
jgi:hypothetical protein